MSSLKLRYVYLASIASQVCSYRTMESLFGPPAIVAPAAAFLLWISWKIFLEPSVLPDLPIVGLDRSQWFAWPRTLYKSFHSFRELYGEAYEKVCLFAIFLLVDIELETCCYAT